MPKTEEENAFVLGDIEELIILAILRLDSQAYGVAIQDLLEKATKKTMNVRLLYSTLQSLESNGLIKPIEAGPPPPGEKRARRCYAATVAGKQALKRTAAQRRAWSEHGSPMLGETPIPVKWPPTPMLTFSSLTHQDSTKKK